MTARENGMGTSLRNALLARMSPKQRFMGRMFYTAFAMSGFSRALQFMRESTRVMKGLEARYGSIGQNIVMSLTGLWNGCQFCGVNHLYTANIMHFRKTGKVLPLDETEIVSLQLLKYEDLVRLLSGRFSAPEWDEQRRVIERLFALYSGAASVTEEDALLRDAIEAWKWVNECTIQLSYDMRFDEIQLVLDEHPAPELLRAYQGAREVWRNELNAAS